MFYLKKSQEQKELGQLLFHSLINLFIHFEVPDVPGRVYSDFWIFNSPHLHVYVKARSS